jgi:hypothetical protein
VHLAEAATLVSKDQNVALREGDILFRLKEAKAWVQVEMKISDEGSLILSRKVTTRQRAMSALPEYGYEATFTGKTLGLSFHDVAHGGNIKVVVNYVQVGSPAAFQGIQLGDTIAALNGTAVLGTASLRGVISVLPRPMVLKLSRDPKKIAGTEKAGSMMTLTKEMLSKAQITVHSKPKASRQSMKAIGAAQAEYWMFEVRLGVRMLQFACKSDAEMRGWINGFRGKVEPQVDRLRHSEAQLAAQFGIVSRRSGGLGASLVDVGALRRLVKPETGSGKRESASRSSAGRLSMRASAVSMRPSTALDGDDDSAPSGGQGSANKLMRVQGGMAKPKPLVVVGSKGPRRTGVTHGLVSTNRFLNDLDDTAEGEEGEDDVTEMHIMTRVVSLHESASSFRSSFASSSSPPHPLFVSLFFSSFLSLPTLFTRLASSLRASL